MKTMTTMNKMRMMILALVAMMALGFTSCSKDDDNNGGTQAGKVQAVEVNMYYSVSEDLAKIIKYTVTWYDADGQLQSQVLDGKAPFELNVKYNPEKSTRYGYEITAEYKGKGVKVDGIYDVSYCYKDIKVSAWINGQENKYLSSGGRAVQDAKWHCSDKDSFRRMFVGSDYMKNKTCFYKLTDTGLERVYSF